MELKIQSIHFDATEKLQAFIEKKIAKLEKTYEDIQKVEVQLKVVKPATALNKETCVTVKNVTKWQEVPARLRNKKEQVPLVQVA